MLEITVPQKEFWDPIKEEFLTIDKGTLQLEHSLISISKWESKWHKPFYGKDPKSVEEVIDYIKCMTIGKVSNPDIYITIANTDSIVDQIQKYIDDPMTATWFSESKDSKGQTETITSELVYYWMISFNIPFECEKWHFNRLLTLVRVCAEKNKPAKKQKSKDTAKTYAEINAQRQAAWAARKAKG